MVKYHNEIRNAYLSVFATDRFYYDIDADAAISMIQAEWAESYEEMSKDLDIGLANGYSITYQLECFAEVVKYRLELSSLLYKHN